MCCLFGVIDYKQTLTQKQLNKIFIKQLMKPLQRQTKPNIRLSERNGVK